MEREKRKYVKNEFSENKEEKRRKYVERKKERKKK